MATTLFRYLYRDADNYKAWGVIALNGLVEQQCWNAALKRLESGEFFVAEQLDVPPLYDVLAAWSGGPTPADHCWHAFAGIEVVARADDGVYQWGDTNSFVTRLLAVDEWRGDLSPNFTLGLETRSE